MSAYLADFPPVASGKLRLHQHAGGEFIFVLRGALQVRIGSDDHVLEPEDSMYFDSSVPHGYRRSGTRACSAIVVTAL
jgi:quercetin dioxygenase-like cupin family protein